MIDPSAPRSDGQDRTPPVQVSSWLRFRLAPQLKRPPTPPLPPTIVHRAEFRPLWFRSYIRVPRAPRRAGVHAHSPATDTRTDAGKTPATFCRLDVDTSWPALVKNVRSDVVCPRRDHATGALGFR